MVTTEINDHKSEMNNEIKVLSVAITDQIKDVVHNPKWHQKVDFKARAAALKLKQHAEYARGSEDRYKQQAAKAEQERQQRRKRVEVPE